VKEQLDVVFRRDGLPAALDYAKQTLEIYRKCARPQRDGRKHFAHAVPFRPHFVRSIIHLRGLLKQEKFLRENEALIMTALLHTEGTLP
jgi:hypothetical protein